MRTILLFLIGSCIFTTQSLGRGQKQTATVEKPLGSFLENYMGPAAVGRSTDRYVVTQVDLKEDGTQEFIVYITDPQWCGTGGCTLLILTPEDNSYRIVTKITVAQLPIRMLATKTKGWHDLGVWVQGGGVQLGYEARLSFNGETYPTNPSVPPAQPLKEKVEGKLVISSTMLRKSVKQDDTPTHIEMVNPGMSVGNLELGMNEADFERPVFSWQPKTKISQSEDSCHYKSIFWVNIEGNYPTVLAYLGQEGVVQIDATGELQVRGIGSVYGKRLSELKNVMPGGELLRWRGSAFQMPSQRDEFFWIVPSKGIAFGLDYDRSLKTRTVISTTIFKPQGKFQPGGCLRDPEELIPVDESRER